MKTMRLKILRSPAKVGKFAALSGLLVEGRVYDVEEPMAELLLDEKIAEVTTEPASVEPPPAPHAETPPAKGKKEKHE